MEHSLGRHLLVDFAECNTELLDDEQFLRSCCADAAREMGATVMGVHSHRFEPHGVSVMVILAESHLSLHSWPEFGMASSDVYVCGGQDPEVAKRFLAGRLEAGHACELEVERGRMVRKTRYRERSLVSSPPGS
jgi:S-adenosylmethionine decarboxylase proenzyme